MLFREIPFLRLFAPLCAGVIVAEVLPHGGAAAWIMTAAAAAVMTLRLFHKSYHSDPLFGAALIIFLMAAGYLLHITGKERLSNFERSRQLFMVRISGYPEKKNNSCSFRAKIIPASGDDQQYTPHGSLLLYFISDTLPSAWQPGDKLLVRLTPQPVVNNGNPCEFNYRRYLEGQGIKYFGFFRAADVLEYQPAGRLTVRERSLVAAHRMIGAFRKAGLEGEELGLVTALTIGDKDLIDKEHLTTFSRSGAMHIMAVSGMHVGMISLGLSFLLFFLRGRLQILKVLIIMAGLWGFAFITGMSPSVLRATIMFTFLQAGTLMHRPATGINNLLSSAFILTAARPAVIFEAGFQLSYLAVAFIILFYEPLYRAITIRKKIPDYLWQMVAVSLVAQAGTLALAVRLFNIFPLLFLATNIVVIPISFIVLALAFLLIVFSAFTPVASFFALLLGKLSGFTLSFTGMISSLDLGVVENIGLTTVETILLTTAAALLLTSLLKMRKITLKPFIVAASLFIFSGIVRNLDESRKERVIVYNIRGKELRARQHGRVLMLTTDDGIVPPEVKKHASTRGLKIKIMQTR
ncbi:MAG: ComEC/Rec2 family competence protein [Bacteroidales bacterium]